MRQSNPVPIWDLHTSKLGLVRDTFVAGFTLGLVFMVLDVALWQLVRYPLWFEIVAAVSSGFPVVKAYATIWRRADTPSPWYTATLLVTVAWSISAGIVIVVAAAFGLAVN